MSEEQKPAEVERLPRIVRIRARFGIMSEFIGFLWDEKIWWMIPMVVVLLGFGLLMVFASTNAAYAPFIYTLF